MSLYREVGGGARKRIAAFSLGALLLGLIAGYAIGRATAPEPTLSEQIADARAAVQPVKSAVELVGIEYPQAVEDGKVAEQTEYDAAVAQATAASDGLAAVADLEQVDPDGVAAAREAVEQLAAAVQAADPEERVAQLQKEAQRAVDELASAGSAGA